MERKTLLLCLHIIDPTLPAVCQMQSMFLSHNYMTSDLQQQEVQGCTNAPAGGINPEVHVIKLHSAGSALCGWEHAATESPGKSIRGCCTCHVKFNHLLSARLLQLTPSGGDCLPCAPGGQLKDPDGCADSQQLGASQLGHCCSWCPGSCLCSCKGPISLCCSRYQFKNVCLNLSSELYL